MGVHAGEVGDPVAVIGCAFLAGRSLHRLVLKDGGKPESGRPQAADIVEPTGQACEIAAVEKAGIGRIVAGDQTVARQPAPVV